MYGFQPCTRRRYQQLLKLNSTHSQTIYYACSSRHLLMLFRQSSILFLFYILNIHTFTFTLVTLIQFDPKSLIAMYHLLIHCTLSTISYLVKGTLVFVTSVYYTKLALLCFFLPVCRSVMVTSQELFRLETELQTEHLVNLKHHRTDN